MRTWYQEMKKNLSEAMEKKRHHDLTLGREESVKSDDH